MERTSQFTLGGWLTLALAWLGSGSALAQPSRPALAPAARAVDGELVIGWSSRGLIERSASHGLLVPGYVVERTTDLRRWEQTAFRRPSAVVGMPTTHEFRQPLVGSAAYFRVVEVRDFAGADLAGADLSLADLSRCSFAGADLAGARLDNAVLVGADLEGANLEGATLEGADLALANLHGANLTGANLRHANLAQSRVSRADLTNADLTGAALPPWNSQPTVIYRNTTLPDGTLGNDSNRRRLWVEVLSTGADGLDLSDADLSELDLRGVELAGAVLTRANLVHASLSHADLRGADLSHARLDAASLAYAYLQGADLSGASLSGADLTGANLTGAKLPPSFNAPTR